MRPAALDADMPMLPVVPCLFDHDGRARGWRWPAGTVVLAWVLALACTAAPRGDGLALSSGESPRPSPTGDPRRAEVRFPRGRLFVVEIADTPVRRQQGYMFRREVGENEGMIFVFPEHPRRLVRISAQLYNSREQFELLARALCAELESPEAGAHLA